MKYIILAVIYISVISDALRDSWIIRKHKIKWLLWHQIKWLSMFSLWIMLSMLFFYFATVNVWSIAAFIIFMLGCKFSWKAAYKWGKDFQDQLL